MVRYLAIISLILTAAPAWAADGFTQQDRDLLIELKVRVDQSEKRMDERFEQVDKRFDDMFNFFYILTGIFTAIIVASIGFSFWGRRTVIRQARKEAIEFIEQEGLTRRMLDALRAEAQENEALAKAMRSSHLL